MVSPQARALDAILRQAPKAVEVDLPHQREAGEHAEDLAADPVGVAYAVAENVAGLWATPDNWDGRAALMYLSGGGYVISSPATRRKLAGHLALASRARVLVPRYRLAPEHPFPAAVEDAVAACLWLVAQGIRSQETVIAGDSNAGGLAIATMLKLREDGSPLPAGCVAISPWVDLACSGESLESRAAVDLTVTKASLQRMAGQYLHGTDPRTPLASPLYAELAGLPPLLVVVGGNEVLLDDAVRLVRAAGIAGVDATLVIGGGMQHGYPIYAGYLPEADATVALIGRWIRERVSGDRGWTGMNITAADRIAGAWD